MISISIRLSNYSSSSLPFLVNPEIPILMWGGLQGRLEAEAFSSVWPLQIGLDFSLGLSFSVNLEYPVLIHLGDAAQQH
jgi:hypothetical protein